MFYILSREKKKAWSTHGDGEYETYEDAKYDVEAMQEIDKANGEEWEYRIVEVEKIERR